MGTNRKLQKEYYVKLKNKVADQTTKISQQYKRIPHKVLKSLEKINRFRDLKLNIYGVEYTLAEALKEYRSCYKRINYKSKQKAYIPILNSFIKDTKGFTEDPQFNKIYVNYIDILDSDFKHTFSDIKFCLYTLKAINSSCKK